MKGNSSALRKGRFSEFDRIYLITFATYNRKPILNNFELARSVIKAMRYQQGNCMTLAFVIMPDHVHWLIQLKNASLAQIVHSVKSYSSVRINEMVGSNGPVWQKGFHDHALRKEEDLKNLARYVVLNPVRAGLVRSVREFSLWDAVWV